MKVRPETQAQEVPPSSTAPGGSGEVSNNDGGGDSTQASGRSFAAVLDNLSEPLDEQRDAGPGRNEEADGGWAALPLGHSSDAPERRPASSHDKQQGAGEAAAQHGLRSPKSSPKTKDQSGEATTGRGAPGETFAPSAASEPTPDTEAVSTRSIIPIADLESIVSAVRTQLTVEGRREVTIELSRSVLEGLHIKIASDATGRLSAEFITSSARVKTQLDLRAQALTELLRSRGINLSALKTSLAQHPSGQGDAGDRQRHGPGEPAPAVKERASRPTSSVSDEEPAEDNSTDESLKIYRA